MPNLQIDEAIENTSFLRNCMNMHSMQHRKRSRKVHQYAPDRRHKTSHSKPHNFFIRCHNANFVRDNGIISSSYHHHITASPARSQSNTHAKRGGL
nr:MAG TPA: hypothetical protein [Caudoviricetes sp.]DAU64001.1 MAG TPA: hypothetical protein [Caudoviricetes sp.]